MVTSEYQITGMSCGHCEASVRTEIGRIAGVQNVDISAKTGKLSVSAQDPIDDAEILAAVDEAGYSAVRVP
ncbi:heavy metal transport/detoxification protein [Mycolicibacterium canariasense]|uniref:Heavy metal transport/detoxification protein n=1 Tax=Mycolicibacterium canariasense TaxID=228230 RepID=A0A124E2L8_MYCCR|nr:heavy-metal-associated domain-containing protein [Mycolicibacterium canariasense]MCV7211196.1 heavy-metal-associated domain-containing protein [Mycolicibacterium canariasense]ORV03261.1 heavy metal transporter [Mycolicibacterium canariasense]GAS97234.1 heavy metal transport/detoxification protein [Mycolicibacterium canariasense]